MRRFQRCWRSGSQGLSQAPWDSCYPLQLTNRQVGFKSFLNISPIVTHTAPPPPSISPGRPSSTQASVGASFTLTLDENPLAEFVELPEAALDGGLWFSNVLCGVLRGSLEMVCRQFPILQVPSITRPRRSKCKCRPSSSPTCYEATRALRSELSS